MPLYEVNGKRPAIGTGCWIAPNASVIGDVHIGADCYVGFGAVIRADFGSIEIGDKSVVEDNVVIHAACRTCIGNGVIVAHQAMIHDAEIGDNVLIGMQTLIGDQVIIEADAIVAEQSHVRKQTTVAAGSIVGGRPAVHIGFTTPGHRQAILDGSRAYADLRGAYRICPEN
mgnify:CR=1 FL=1